MRSREHRTLGASTQRWAKALILVICATAAGSCNTLVTEGRSASLLVIDQLRASPGADPTALGNNLQSDVQTFGGVFEDEGQVNARLALKNPGTVTNPTAPTPSNWITVTRYRVTYVRADGRNIPGVDVPYPFDGAVTFTAREIGTPVSASFTIVRVQSKLEPPLRALRDWAAPSRSRCSRR